MIIPLNQFEQIIDPTILKRGLSYFKNGHVDEPEELAPGEYEAIVSGSEQYIVRLSLKNNIVTEHDCDCPYDMGPVCKHIVAVVFALLDDTLNEEKPQKSKRSTKKDSGKPVEKKQTVSQQIDDILKNTSHEALLSFIRESAIKDQNFRNLFLSTFSGNSSGISKELIAKQLKTIVKSACGRHGYIEWGNTSKVFRQVNQYIMAAQKQISEHQYDHALLICFAVMEEMTKAIQVADDSDGDIGGCVDLAFDLLAVISSQTPPEHIRKQLFDYCILGYNKGIYDGWDWHFGLMGLASDILGNAIEAELLLTCLEKRPLSDFDKSSAEQIRLNIYKKTKSPQEVEKYIEANLSNTEFRKDAIQKAIDNKLFDKAISLSKEGIKQDQKARPGLIYTWYDYLLKVAKLQKDTDKIVEYARFLFMNGMYDQKVYYKTLKEAISKLEWKLFVDKLINDLYSRRNFNNSELLIFIFIEEKKLEQQLEYLRFNVSLYMIERFEKELAKDYSGELIELYAEEILNYAKSNTGRPHYVTICKYLRRMKKLGGKQKAEEIVSSLKKQFYNRPALLEELEGV